MARIRLFLLLITGFVLQHCSDDVSGFYTLNQEIQINEAESITVNLEEVQGHINLQVIDITEGRCPSDVVCVWAGNVEVKVWVSGVDKIVKTLDLCIGCQQRVDTVAIEIDGKGYGVILKDVRPYPTMANLDQPKEAILEIISK